MESHPLSRAIRAESGQIRHPHQGIGRCLDKNPPGLWSRRRFHRPQIPQIHIAEGETEMHQHPLKQAIGPPYKSRETIR